MNKYVFCECCKNRDSQSCMSCEVNCGIPMWWEPEEQNGSQIIQDLKSSILNQAANVKENIKAKWFDVGSLSCRCSACGCKNNRETLFCPNCGAKMR